jgi:GNAT superfamily N-acetyltransferase
MGEVELFTPGPEHIPELGRICFEAFRGISEGHGFKRDFPDAATAARVLGLFQGIDGAYCVAARVQGRIVGSNFLLHTDTVAGLGPITVDPHCQGHGAGRALMQAALDFASHHGITQVRLLQDAYNTASLSLYASLGFAVREPIGLMNPKPAPEDASVRKAHSDDLAALGELGLRIYKVSRRRELAVLLERNFPVLVRERAGRLSGYLAPGTLGHGVAETEEDALALIGQIPHHAAPGFTAFMCPIRCESFFRAALRAGCRLSKVMNLMSLGPYISPESVWMPSISF